MRNIPWKKILFYTIVTPILGLVLYTWTTLHYVYANGERAGYVQKFSKKGWICKTWEGELAMVNLPGAMPQIFNFSVRSEAVAESIQKSIGQRVAITYEQHRGIPTSCFGETEYFLTRVQTVTDAVPPK